MPIDGAAPSVPGNTSSSMPSTLMRPAPALATSSLVQIEPSTPSCRESRSRRSTLNASRPLLPMLSAPPVTVKPFKPPSLPRFGVPVVSVTREVLRNPQPSQEMPLGLAITNCALAPAISVYPCSRLLADVTSLRISEAAPLRCRLLLPAT
ncbi:hypothetical protein FHT10_000025 [Xanthomonas arboricola]